MAKIKEMPFSEKYAKVIDNIKFDESFIFPFVHKHLGNQAVVNLRASGRRDLSQFLKGLHLRKSMKSPIVIGSG